MCNGHLVRSSLSVFLIGLLVSLAGCNKSSTPFTSASTTIGSPPSSTSSSGGYLGALGLGNQKALELQALNNLRQIGIAFHSYYDANGVLPTQTGMPNGNSKLSWRVALLPFIEEKALYQQFKLDEPWDSTHNKKLLERMPDCYRDPRFQTKESKPTETFFQGFTGKGGVLGTPGGLDLTGISNANGTSNTFLFVEAGTPVPWTKPEDLVHDPSKPLPPLAGPKPGPYFLALFCDAHVQRIPTSTDEKTLRCMIQWDNPTPFIMPGGK